MSKAFLHSSEFLSFLREHAPHQDGETIREAWDILKRAYSNASYVAAFHYNKGDRVSFPGRRGRTLTGTVIKVNRSTLSVDCGPDRIWRVKASGVKKVS